MAAVCEMVLCRLDMLVPLDPKRDLRLGGQVIYTGNSSMEVAVKMEHIGMDEPEETVLLGAFTHKVKVQLLIA